MRKFEEIAQMLRRRIEKEDYGFQNIPGARRLAEETGISYVTALKALRYMVDSGWASRGENGRLVACPQTAGDVRPALRVAFLCPVRDNDYFLWEHSVQKAAVGLGCTFRMVFYTHAEDPVIAEVITGSYDVVFISHNLQKGSYVRELVLRHHKKIVTLFMDMTAEGVRCLDGPAPADAQLLVKHLYDLGHRRFASVMICPETASTSEKITAWNAAASRCGCPSREIRRPLPPFELTLLPSYELAKKLLREKTWSETAVFAPTLEIAIGMIRAAHELGLRPGTDLSICSFGQPERARLHIPSITVIDRPDPTREAGAILRQYLEEKTDRLMFRSGEGVLIRGESTGRAPAHQRGTGS